jgi:hypothetical protein
MKKSRFRLRAIGVIFLLAAANSPAVVFTNHTSIGALDASYDGADVIITNCTVTLDGAHSFNSLFVAPGGVLTHSYFPNATSTLLLNVTDEPQILVSTNPVTLAKLNVFAAVTVSDTNHLVIYTNDVDFVQYAPGDGTTQIYRTETSSIPDGATVLVSYTWSYFYGAGLTVIVTNDVNIAAGGSINANGIGYGPALGGGRGFTASGSFADGSGAGHGGSGGLSLSNAVGGNSYGTIVQPATLGSGGGASYLGAGGNGGGKIQISAGGTVNIDGLLTVNGADATNSRAGGGAGGSIWITANNFTGTGMLTANGGGGEPVRGGGGGGGRIAIQYGTNNFSGNLTAFGGIGAQSGGAGTIFSQLKFQNGSLLVDNGGRNGTNTPVALPLNATVMIRSNAIVTPTSSWSAGNVTLASGGKIQAVPLAQMILTVTGTLAVQAGGAISADRLGNTAGSGTGAGRVYQPNSFYYCTGAGHGGNGAVGLLSNPSLPAGGTYGSQNNPNSLDFGSGGGGSFPSAPGGSGGGVLSLSIYGTLQVDGTISANGGNGSGTGGGGGSGGGIAITTTTIAGNGAILANGGNGAASYGGGGGGGRISVNCTSNTFTGTFLAAGGGGANYGGAGTIYLFQGSVPVSVNPAQLILDNAGHSGTNTPVTSAGNSPVGSDLTIRNGAVGSANNPVGFRNINILSNSWLATIGPTVPASLSITASNITIQAGGGITGDGFGYAANAGNASGAGTSSINAPNAGNGAGHGGAGALCTNTYLPGSSGAINDNVVAPGFAGSGGGGNVGAAPISIGGRGGGLIQLTVYSRLQVDGVLSANAASGAGLGGGGGAGGGLNLPYIGALSGSGTIRANGGNGANGLGGGGGGGCIAIYYTTNNFSGPITAHGGSGFNTGGAGTIYLKNFFANRASLIVDNGGRAGANSATLSSSTTDLILQNGGIVNASGSLQVANLIINSSAWIFVTNGTQAATWTLNASGNVTVQAGGGISADASGFRQGQGSGAGGNYANAPFYQSAGGGHAGYGGDSTNANSKVSGGSAGFDSLAFPTLAGSGGGGYSTYSSGGNGGGMIQLNVTSNLLVNGTLAANGGSGSGVGGGGGAGGTVNLNVGGLLGGGVIAANGGEGVIGVGGGGGGGNIACAFTSNLFSGTFSAGGGGGANFGGAGLVYLRTNSGAAAILIADNAGHRGTNTPVSAAANSSALVIRNGAMVTPISSALQSVASLLINSNGWLSPANNSGGILQLMINGNATVQSGGGILADALGNAQNTGSGRGFTYGSSSYYPGTGASHGGCGAAGITNASSPVFGITYGSTTSPTAAGSGGGGNAQLSIGGSGGGFVNLRVNGALQLDGLISVNGGNGSGYGGGGGSGGSLNLNFGSFGGTGSITANGGDGVANTGGGGGGGRIAIYFNTNLFTGHVTAFGGGGANYGGAGTVYFKTNSQPYGLLVLDNHHHLGTNSAFDFINMDVTIQNQAVGQLPTSGSWSAHNLLIRTNGTLLGTPSSSPRSLIANNLTIDAGGALSLDGGGNAASTGPGAAAFASANLRGGGGHGGYGGGNAPNFGKAYGSILVPTTPGSGGGSFSSGNGGAGGGALFISVLPPNTLTVNGRLSANGGNGDFGAGGGSGGSLNFSFLNKLSGTGVISADGGAATGSAGGGGGGRIAFSTINSNNFSGQITAFGGTGIFPGGAGTICLRSITNRMVLVNNGGIAGTNTPLGSSFGMPNPPFDLNIFGAAIVVPVTSLPLINNLNLAAGSTFTVPAARSNLFLGVLKNAQVAGSLIVDTLGYEQANGPGAGTSLNNQGSGGGHGGAGGNAANGAAGGVTNGSAAPPVDFGSGGGSGVNHLTGGSAGGGAVRLSVGGILNLDGTISANGDYGWQDNSGGGSGGSIWISASSFSGAGLLSAFGGNGDLWNGGGGGGGRIAICSPTNLFAGFTNVSGGFGAVNGSPGTIFFSATFGNFLAQSQSPTGTVNNTVGYVDIAFSDAVDSGSLSSAGFTLTTPLGVLDSSVISMSALDATTLRVSFPVQNLNGNYSLAVTSGVASIFGQSLAQPFSGSFTIAVPTVSGAVTDTAGAPVAGVTIQPDVTLPAAVTDANGNYSVGVPPGWSGNFTPSLGEFMFVPRVLSFGGVAASLTNQNFLMVTTIAPQLATSLSGTNLSLTWTGIFGVTYQAQSSTNLVDWTVYGGGLNGTNGTMEFVLPVDPSSPGMFFRLGAAN